VTLNLPAAQRIGSAGPPLPGCAVRIAPDGEVLVQGPSVFSGYWRNEAATSEAWRGSACTVGDMGELDADGYLYLSGRRHDLIISGGVNVYPAEVEAVLAALPGIIQVGVFGLPDEQWGQRVCVAYVADSTGMEDAMRAAAVANLAPYKRPKDYFATAELPHTATGKLMRRSLPEHLGLTWGDGATLR
jgi:long-chain acyl-CoA synthetase